MTLNADAPFTFTGPQPGRCLYHGHVTERCCSLWEPVPRWGYLRKALSTRVREVVLNTESDHKHRWIRLLGDAEFHPCECGQPAEVWMTGLPQGPVVTDPTPPPDDPIDDAPDVPNDPVEEAPDETHDPEED